MPLSKMDEEGREMSHFALYMDLTAMHYLQDNPLHLLRDYPQYEITSRMNLPRYRDACREVQEGIRVTAQYNILGAEGIIHLATGFYKRDTLASRTALFWLENALKARVIINRRPNILKTRTLEEIAVTKSALAGIEHLREQKAA